jgi:hypothetical protein
MSQEFICSFDRSIYGHYWRVAHSATPETCLAQLWFINAQAAEYLERRLQSR